jgi:hypothetical protein
MQESPFIMGVSRSSNPNFWGLPGLRCFPIDELFKKLTKFSQETANLLSAPLFSLQF